MHAFREMRMRSYRIGEPVVRYGEIGNEFFVILTGSVSVRVPTTVRCDLRDAYIEALIEHYDSVMWKTVEGYENVKFIVEGEIKERLQG